MNAREQERDVFENRRIFGAAAAEVDGLKRELFAQDRVLIGKRDGLGGDRGRGGDQIGTFCLGLSEQHLQRKLVAAGGFGRGFGKKRMAQDRAHGFGVDLPRAPELAAKIHGKLAMSRKRRGRIDPEIGGTGIKGQDAFGSEVAQVAHASQIVDRERPLWRPQFARQERVKSRHERRALAARREVSFAEGTCDGDPGSLGDNRRVTQLERQMLGRKMRDRLSVIGDDVRAGGVARQNFLERGGLPTTQIPVQSQPLPEL